MTLEEPVLEQEERDEQVVVREVGMRPGGIEKRPLHGLRHIGVRRGLVVLLARALTGLVEGIQPFHDRPPARSRRPHSGEACPFSVRACNHCGYQSGSTRLWTRLGWPGGASCSVSTRSRS